MQEETKDSNQGKGVAGWLKVAAGLGIILAAGVGMWSPGGMLAPHNVQWTQDYASVGGNLFLSALVAGLPVIIIFVLLAGLRKPAHLSTITGLVSTILLAVFVWKMPFGLAVNSTLFGMIMAVFPILWTLANAVWIFNMLVESGFFETLKESLGSFTRDRRIQTLLIGFGFTTLLEAIAAFGAPIAIVAAMLVGFGFPPMLAAVITLLSDTTIASWGTQGMPIVVLNSVTELDINALAAMVGRQAPVATMIFPAALIIFLSGWKGFKEVWHVTLAMGVAYLVVAVLTSMFWGPYIVGIAASLASMLVLMAVMKFWKPKNTWLLPSDNQEDSVVGKAPPVADVVRAWSPYFLLVLVIGLINSTGIKGLLESVSMLTIKWPGLHNAVLKTAPVVSGSEAYSAVYSQPVLAVGGTLVLFAGLLSMVSLKVKPGDATRIYFKTLHQLILPGLTIVSIVGIAYLMNYSSMTYTIGLAFASTGFWYPMATTFLGMIGCTLAGSVAASNALFGNLAVVGGNQIGISPILSAGTLSSGGTMGKAIAFQDIAIATGALNLQGREGDLIRRVFWMSVGFAVFLGVIAMVQQHLLPGMIP